MATYNLNIAAKLDASETNVVLVDNGSFYQHTSTVADQVNLPKASTAGNKAMFTIIKDGATGTLTVAARAGETYIGDAALANDNDTLLVFRTGALEWTGLIQPVAAVT